MIGYELNKQWITWHWKLQGLGLGIIAFLSLFPSAFHYEEYLFFVLFLTSVGASLRQGTPFLTKTPIDLPLALLIGWVLLSVPFSTDPSYSFTEWRKLLANIFVFYWTLLVLGNFKKPHYWRYVIRAIFMGVLLISIYGVFDFVEKGGTLANRHIRAIGPNFSSVWLATYIIMIIPFIVVFYFGSKKRLEKLAHVVIFIMALIAEFTTYSRGGWTALATQGIALGLISRKRRLLLWGLAVNTGILIFMLQFSQLGYLGGVFTTETITSRLSCWALGIETIQLHPILGVGFGNDIFSTSYQDNQLGSCEAGHLHNTFLMYAMGSGLPAFTFLAWTFFIIIKSFSRATTDCESAEAAKMNVAGGLMVAGFAVSMSFDYLFTGSLAHLFWILVAVCFSLGLKKEEMPLQNHGHDGSER